MCTVNNCSEMLREEDDRFQEACGLFGCVASGDWPTNLDISRIIYFGLVALQHRGQDFGGIATGTGDLTHYFSHKGIGLMNQAFTEDDLKKLKGNLGIGHTKYSTQGGTNFLTAQPFVVHTKHGLLAVAHNGGLVNSSSLRKKVLEKGIGLSTGSDSEILTQILCEPPPGEEPDGPDIPARIKRLMSMTETAYSLLIMFGDTIYAVRDPYGNRPLCIGKLLPSSEISGANASDELDGYVVASESCAFFPVLGELIREVLPGEILEIKRTGIRSIYVAQRQGQRSPAFCIFEYIYFANTSSILEGQMVYTARYECGKQLAIEAPVDADITSCVPDSATPAAQGFALQSGIPYKAVFHINRYAPRAFIQPNKRLRELAVRMKFGTLDENFKGKKIVLIDDSIVRGTTVGKIIKLLTDAGAAEVHLRIASPPVRHPCYMGINISSKDELIANTCNANQLAKKLGAASVVYLSFNGLVKAVKENTLSQNGKITGNYCKACLTGEYPIDLEW